MNNIDFIYPPEKDKAQRHRLASRIFKGIEDQHQHAEECACCGRKVGLQEVETPCNIDPTQLSFLGPGAPLFFHFNRYIIYLLAIMVAVFVGFSIFSNATSSDCQSTNACITDGFTLLSIINKSSNTKYLAIQSYISLGFVLVTIIYFHYFRYQARKLEQECDDITNSPSDYAIILRRLPQNIQQRDIQQAIETFKNELISEGNQQAKKTKVVKIVLSYSLRQYNLTKEENINQFRQSVKENRFNEFKPKQLKAPSEISKIAIVIFDLQSTKDLFIYKPNIGQSILKFFCTACTPRSNLVVKGQRVGVERAPEPDQILWQNSGITMKGTICRKLLYGLIAIIILLLGGVAQYGLQLLSASTQDSTTKFLLGIASSVIVTVFNAVILITLQITTKKERAQTLTQFQTSLMVKITLSQFFNAGIFVIIAQIAANYKTFSLQTSNIASQISLIMILDAVIPNAILFFMNYFEIIERIKRFLIQKKFIIASQKELNELYISPAIDLPNKYAYVLKTLWLTGLYSPMIPIVVVIALIGLIVNYFLQKFLFTKCYSMPFTISTMAFQSAVELLQYFLITFAIGEFIIYAYFYNYKVDQIPTQWTITIAITVGLALLNSALPMQVINEKLFVLEDSSKSKMTYRQAEQNFEVTYEMSNPAYKGTRKRKQSKSVHAYSSVKSKQKQEQFQLTNLMLNKRLETKNISGQPLLKELGNQIIPLEEASSSKQQSAMSPKVLLNSRTLRDSPINQVQNPAMKLLPSQQATSKHTAAKDQINNNTLHPIQIKYEQINKKNSSQVTQLKRTKAKQDELTDRSLQIQKMIKRNSMLVQQRAISKFKYLEIKPIKTKRQWNYEPQRNGLQSKPNSNQLEDKSLQKQSALIFDPKNNTSNHMVIDQDFQNILKDQPTSKSSVLIQEPQKKKNAIFDDPVKEKKSTYDPIKLSANYRNFFSDLQTMKQQQGKYLNGKYVMSFLGTPFTNLMKQQLESQKSGSNGQQPQLSL